MEIFRRRKIMRRKVLKILSVLVIMVMALSFVFTGCSSINPEMKITIDGKDLQLDCKVKDILDAGFELGETGHKNSIIKDFPDLEARTMISSSFYIFKDGVPANVGIGVYNKSYQAEKFEDCTVYEFKYDCDQYAYRANEGKCLDVKFNGIDFHFTDRQQVIGDLEGQGFKFDEKDKTSFLADNDPYSDSLLSAKGLFERHLTIFNNYDYDSGNRFINGFEFAIKIDYDTSGAWTEPNRG